MRARLAARASPRLLGFLASPQLLAQLLASGHHSASPVYPSCMHLRRPGAGVPTRGTSHWGHPLRVERTSWPDASSFWPLMRIHSSTSSAAATHVLYTTACMCTSACLVSAVVERARNFHHPTPCSAYITVCTGYQLVGRCSVFLGHYFHLRLRSRASVR
jgi:hypothetical protein